VWPGLFDWRAFMFSRRVEVRQTNLCQLAWTQTGLWSSFPRCIWPGDYPATIRAIVSLRAGSTCREAMRQMPRLASPRFL
jgi:hypothetical protein